MVRAILRLKWEDEIVNCPVCDSIKVFRVRRSWWQRLLPSSRRYACTCGAHFLAFAGLRLPLKTKSPAGQQPS